MRKFYRLGISMLLLLAGALPAAFAYNFESGGIYYNITGTSPNTVAVTYATGSYNSYSGNVVIPSTVTNDGITYTVTGIGNNAFRNCSGLTGVSIPGTVTSIGEYAFYYCQNLPSVTIPNGVETIGANAFYYCRNTTSVSIGNTVTTIGNAAFQNCSGLTAVSIPNSVTTIGSNAFQGCSALTTLTIGESVTNIGNSAFQSCSSLASITIPHSVTTIGEYAFRYCNSLTSVSFNADSCEIMGTSTHNVFSNCIHINHLYIGNNVKNIPNYAFNGCDSLTSLYIPDAVSYIAPYAFYNCRNISSISVSSANSSYDSRNNCNAIIHTPTNTLVYGCNTSVIPNTVTAIGELAFSGRTGLTGTLVFPSSVSYIGPSAFNSCSGITSLIIGESIDSIGVSAFANCTGLTSLTFNADSCTVMGYNRLSNSNYATVFTGCNNLSSLSIGDNVMRIPDFAFYSLDHLSGMLFLPDSLMYIGDCAFYNCSSLTGSLVIPRKVSIIGANAFYNCSGITTLVYNADSCAFGGEYYTPVFSGCSNLTTLTIGENVKIIPDLAFSGCSNLSGELFIPNSVKSIGFCAFRGCSGLTGTLTLPFSLKTIGACAFYNCNGLIGELTIPDSVTSIGYWAFYNCVSITSLIIGKSVQTIGHSAFYSCSGLTSVVFNPDSCTDMGYGVECYISQNNTYCPVFQDCSSFNSLVIGENVKTIPNYAFASCDALISVSFLSPTSSIGVAAFSGCSNLSSLTLPNSLKTIGQSAFYGCSNLTSLTIPDSVTIIAENAFNNCIGLDSLIIGKAVTSIGDNAFGNCSALSFVLFSADKCTYNGYYHNAFANSGDTTTLIISENVKQLWTESPFKNFTGLTTVYFYADSCTVMGREYYPSFPGCTNFTNLIIGDNVKIIPAGAFNDCIGMTGTLNIPNSVKMIGSNAFYGCKYDSLIIGSGVITIEKSAFRNCSELTSVTFNADSCVTMGQPYGQVYYSVFDNCNNLSSLSIGDNVKSIPSRAFNGCSNITGTLIIPKSVKFIGNSAFYNCIGLTSIAFNADSCTEASNAFSGTSLTSLSIGENVKHLPSSIFRSLSSLTGTLSIPDSVIVIGDYAFYGCTGLDTLDFGRSVASIGNSAFYNCTGLVGKLNIPNSVTSIGNSAFYGCSGFDTLVIGNSVTAIGSYAFQNCIGLSGTLTIPNSVTLIKGGAFRSCSSIDTLIIGKSVQSIEGGAFYDCSALTSIFSYNETPPTLTLGSNINSHPFGNVNRNTPVYVPCGSAQSYQNSWTYTTTNSNPYFYNIYESLQPYHLTALPEDTLKGAVQITTQPTCTESPVIEATPNFFYVFDHWSDGNTDNPRTIEVTQDTVLVALFREYALTVASNDTAYGQAVILQEPTAANPQATIAAVIDPNSTSSFLSNGSLRFVQFTHWSDGNTENPRTITLTSDTSLIAYFNTLDIIIYDTSYGHVEVLQEPTAENPTAIIEAIPSTCTEFYGWGSYYLSDTTNPLIINLTQDTIIYAFFVDKFDVEISGEKHICEGDTGVLTASGATYYLWLSWNSTNGQWDTVCTSDSLFYTESQYYDVIGIDSAGCSSRSGVNVYVQTYHPIVIFSGKTDVCEGESATITASTLGDYGLAEDFSTGIPSDWTVSNNVLQTYNLGGEHGTAIMLPGYSIPNNTIDELILPTMNLHYISSPGLFFDVAYRGPFSGGSTSLKVLLSLDEGATWTVLYSRSGSQLSAYNYYDNEFFPTDNQWLSQNKSLPDSGNAQIKFVFKGGQSNNLWVDNIRVYSLSDPYSYYYQWGDYQWGDGSTERKRTFDSTGVYQVTITNVCSTTDSVTINIWEPSDTTEITVNTPESYYVMNGETFCTSGDYTLNLQNVHGCDSVVILHLTVTPHFTVVNDTVFGRRFVSDNGSRQQIDGRRYSYQYKMTPDNYAQWADSVLTMWTEWYDSTSIALSYDSATSMASWGAIYVYDYRKEPGSVVSQKTIYLDASYIDSVSYEVSDTLTFLSSFGCDSSVIWKTLIYFKDNVELYDLEECNYVWQGDSIYYLDYRYSSDRVVMGFAAGDTLTESGKYRQKLTNVSGCDSTVYWYLTIHPTVYEDITVNACDSYTHNGVTYTESGEYIQNADTLLTIDRKIFSPSGGWCYLDRYGVLISIHPNGWSSLQYDHTEIDDETGGYLYYYKFTDQYGVEHPYIMGDTILYTDTVPGCSVTTLHLTINPSVTELVEATACDSYTWNDSTYTTSGEYLQTFTADNGCDSTVTLQLTINESKHTDTTAESCGSYTWNETTYTSSGEYTQTFTAANGCDSTVTLQLTILPLPTPNITGVTTVCEGQTATLNATGGVSYLWEDGTTTNTYPATLSGLYTVTVTNAEGCSATASTTVTVNPLPEVVITGSTAICPGGSTVLTATGADSYMWSNGSSNPSIPVNMFGQYSVIGTSAAGCFSTASVTVLVSQPPVITVSGNTDICAGESTTLTANGGVSYMWSNGSTADTLVATTAGSWQVIGYNADGCSNMASVTVNLWQPASSNLYITSFDSCYVWFGTPRCESGDYTYTLQTIHGCDSVITLHLTLEDAIVTEFSATACDSYTWNGATYTVSGNYTQSFTAFNGNDSIVTLHLTINNPVHTATTAESCSSYDWNDQTYTVSGDYTYEHLDANGCTQVDTLHLTIFNPVHTAITAGSCGSYVWNGQTYTVSGDYTYEHLDANGCTQVDTLHLTIFNPVHTAITAGSCGSYYWNGQTYTVSGDYTYEHLDANGCTQVDTLHLTVNDTKHVEFADSTCTAYTWNGQTYASSGNYTQTLTAANGCDSVVTLHLTIVPTITPAIAVTGSLTACDNGSATLSVPGNYSNFVWSTGAITPTITVSEAGYYWVTATDAYGCEGVSEMVQLGGSTQIDETPAICMVDVEDSHNLLIWEELSDPDVASYHIYRENNQANVFEPLAVIPAGSVNAFADSTADPSVRAWRYKITAADTCGGETPMSGYHKTVHLTINQGLGNSWNLIWTPYEGLEFASYKLYRGTANNNLQLIQTMPATLTSYTDNNPAGDALFYQIEVVMTEGCVQQTRDITHTGARSNIVYNQVPVMAEETVSACESYDWNGQTITSSGDYTQTFVSELGYDSVVTLHLTIHHTPVFSISGNLAISQGQSTALSVPNNAGWSYLWNTGETASVIIVTPSETTSYSVTVTEGTCNASDSVTVTVNTGIDDHDGFDFTVYPNPTTNIVNVQCTMNNVQAGTMEFHVFDAYGKLVDVVETRYTTSLQTAQIDLSHYASGIYFVKAVADGNVVAVRKVEKR